MSADERSQEQEDWGGTVQQKSLLVGASIIAITIGGMIAPSSAVAQAATAPKPAAKGKAKSASELKREQEAKDRAARKAAPAPAAATPSDESAEVVVTGVRSSLASAREKKRNSEAIMDVVDAEDIGKLPANTVGDVIATLPGIDADRREGEVDNVRLRGLENIQTTLNGTPIGGGSGSSASIADLPAELVKSVEVYKTRTPDQVEGAGAGSVNVETRKPTEFAKNLFVAGTAAGRYNSQSRQINKSYSLVGNFKTDTSFGTLGLTLQGSQNFNPYLESRANNGAMIGVDPRQVVGPQILPYPTYGPRSVYTAYNLGSRDTKNFYGALAWKSGSNDVLIDVNFKDALRYQAEDKVNLPILITSGESAANAPTISNIVLYPGTNRIASLSVTPTSPLQAEARAYRLREKSTLYRVVASHREERFDIKSEISLNDSKFTGARSEIFNRFVTRPTYDVTYGSTEFGYRQTSTIINGIDMLDPNEYRFLGFYQSKNSERGKEFATRTDLVLRTGGDFLRNIRAGVRFSSRSRYNRNATRSVTGFQDPLSALPGVFGQLEPIKEGFAGTGVKNAWRWLGLPPAALLDNAEVMRMFVAQRDSRFATEEIPIAPVNNRERSERTIAGYIDTQFNTKIIFPLEFKIGGRLTNFVSQTRSFKRSGSDPNFIFTPTVRRTNVVNFEPTATSRIKFTKNFSGRLSYSKGIIRPSFNDLRAYLDIPSSSTGLITTGNPDLEPVKIEKFDGVLEWYPGKAAAFTISPFYWKRDGTVSAFTTDEIIDGRIFSVNRPYNTGKGYKRGFEASAQTFFTFLPGILKNFGVIANYTYTDTKLEILPIEGAKSAAPVTRSETSVPKYLFNIAGLFERGTFSAKVSYSYVGALINGYNASLPEFSTYASPRSNLDVGISYTIPKGPLKNLRMSAQGQNLLGFARRTFQGYPDTPSDTWYNARAYGLSVGYKF